MNNKTNNKIEESEYEKKKAYYQEYHIKNSDKLNAKSRKYYEDNKNGKIKDYRTKNKEKLLDYDDNYREQNREILNEKKKIVEKSEKGREYKKKYRENNPIKLKARNKANKLKMKNKKCKNCGDDEMLEFHHTNYELNEGITLCRKCHINLHKEEKRVKVSL